MQNYFQSKQSKMSSAVAKIAKPVMRGMHVADVKKYVQRFHRIEFSDFEFRFWDPLSFFFFLL